jgi:hypothetical protein
MEIHMSFRQFPARAAIGAYTFHSGLEKWNADADRATQVHGFASGTYPFLASVPAPRFAKLLGAGEMALGAALLAPVVPTALAGAALTAFSTGLLGLYAKTPGMRREGSVWPTPQGIGLSKDVWLLGAGLSMLTAGRKG